MALAGALLYHWVAGGFLGEGRRQLERALAAAPEPTPVRARTLVAAAHLAQTQYDLAAAGRWLDEAEGLAERLDEPVLRAHVRGHRGVSALYGGRLDDALSHVEQAVDAHAALGNRFGEVTWRCALAIVQVIGGHPHALETAAEALADAKAHGERWARAHLLMVLGRRAWALRDHDEAKALTISSLELLQGFSDTLGVAKMVEQLAWITASAGDHSRAARLLGAARSLREAAGTTVAACHPHDEDHHARCETEASGALGRAEYHKALAEGAAVDGPAQAIAYALATATTTGTEPAPAPADASPLTRREEQIAALVAHGLTNRRIAAELVLSPRTVDNHVNRILTKLDFSCRAQIAAWWTAAQ
ncbi:helix-turn-helix transcriptional regulator [Streptomyces sp. NPDC001250]|uniref:helix-turn-helix transcriptional regulator n=1 Tax=Streptomyces sp. NPDC001250 TaxID=3154382 RepID=UPI00331BA655